VGADGAEAGPLKRALLVLAVLAGLALPAVAAAHPLGNFTTNHYSRVVASGDRVFVLYVLDLAEIPTFQEKPTAAKLLPKVAAGISLQVDGRGVPLRPVRHALAFPPGVAGLRTTRFESVYASPLLPAGSDRIHYRDATFPGRIGWKEIVVKHDSGARVTDTAAPSQSVSDELRNYPKDQLSSPLDVRSASAELAPGTGPGVPPALSKGIALDSRVTVHQGGDDGFASLISRENLSAGFVALALLLAFFWGAVHALSPGHGKSIVAAYLVGTRGTAKHAALLGLTVTVTHTVGVFALGLITLALSSFIFPEDLYPWLNLASALLVVVVGCGVLRARLRHRRMHAQGHHHHHHHGHHHHHELSMRGLLGVGISGGLIPCPTALVVLLAAISLHRVGYGLVLIVAFSLGLAAAMTGIGLLAVSAKKLAGRLRLDGRLVRALPALSAAVILVLGLVMTVRALPKVI
jgi:ABC-type nickel/cobalt efflux system permease component RcnA